MDVSDRGQERFAKSIVVCHRRALESLRMDTGPGAQLILGSPGEVSFAASVLAAVRFSRLTALTLGCFMNDEVAAAPAVACPALESLSLQSSHVMCDERTWGCWRLLRRPPACRR